MSETERIDLDPGRAALIIQDLQNVGLTAQDLEPLFRSAEAYIAIWERGQDIAAGLHVAAAGSQ